MICILSEPLAINVMIPGPLFTVRLAMMWLETLKKIPSIEDSIKPLPKLKKRREKKIPQRDTYAPLPAFISCPFGRLEMNEASDSISL